ncbi:MAG TPA: holo-ACP synthase [Cyclobacteriaceae bacterium]|nr:holo-ACP synthase [Cyclobacteriaceae bacterium]
MITGVGIDVVAISRIAEKMRKPEFKNAVFTKAEIAYCEEGGNKMQHYAARLAVKEAFLKATGKGMAYDINNFQRIEVCRDGNGQPFIKLNGSFEVMKEAEKWVGMHVSITHEADTAIAVVILEK